MANTPTKIDWDCAATKKHIKEAEAVGLILIGAGRNTAHRTYQCNKCEHEQEISPCRVRRNIFRCQQCFQQTLEKEAKDAGLTLIGAARAATYRTYRFDKCEHEQELSPSSMRKGQVPKCHTCSEATLEEEAKIVGLTLIGAGRDAYYRTYRFDECEHEQEIRRDLVRNNSYRCQQCQLDKFQDEAKAVGLTLIGAGRDANYRTYRFDECEHEQEIQMALVRNNSYRCQQCQLDKIQDEAKAVGLTLIGAGKNKNYKTYRFNKCKHEQEIAPVKVRRSIFRCQTCLQKKLEKEAKDAGLTLIGEGRNSANRTYQFNKCGHEQEISPGAVRKGKDFKCGQCHQQTLEKEAKDAGLTLIGAGRDANHRTYQFNICEHEQEIQASNVRARNFLCNKCEETSRDLPSHVYLLDIQVDEENWLKLGYAKTISTRIKRYGLSESTKVTKLVVINYATGREAHEYEASLHKKYRYRRLLVERMKAFHTKSGAGECYPLSMLDILMKELEARD